MARNPGMTLDASMLARVNDNRRRFASLVGQSVTFPYVKRDGTPTVLSGEVVSLVGTRKDNVSTEAVVILTDKGERSANLWAIGPQV